MAIDLNRQPYFDDFDKNKNFVKILFKPSRPVQVRELNQLQSIQKNQIESFANHVFKSGSKIEGRPPSNTLVNYVTIRSTSSYDNKEINPDKLKFKGVIYRGENNSVEAQLIHLVNESKNISPYTLYINYTKTGTDGTIGIFEDNEIINVVDINGITIYKFQIRCNNINCENYSTDYLKYPTSGKAIIWQVPESTYYTHGYFVDVKPTLIVGEAYETGLESYSIGFNVSENIVNTEDVTEGAFLFDNSLGYPNFTAPGADRLKINLNLSKRSLDSVQNENFILLVKVEEGITTFIKTRSDYNVLMETLAERTYDESGNYTVNKISVKFRDHQKKDESDTYGMFYPKFPDEEDGSRVFGDENKFIAIISPIKAYIKGYLVEKIAETKILMDKSRDLAHIEEFYDRFDSLNYILIELDPVSHITPNDIIDNNVFTNISVDLWDGPIVDHYADGAKIGEIKVYDVEKDNNYYRLYFTDITFSGNNTINDVGSIQYTGDTFFLAAPVKPVETGVVSVYNSDKKTLIFELGKQNVYSIKNYKDNSHGFDYSVKRRLKSTISNGVVIFNTIYGEVFDSYNPNSSFLKILSETGGKAEIASIDFGENNFQNENTIVVNITGHDGKTVILNQKCIRKNNAPKVKYLSSTIKTGKTLDINGVITLDCTDLIYLEKIEAYKTGSPENKTDVTGNFEIFNGNTDIAYLPITLTTQDTILKGDNTYRFDISLIYYEHSSNGSYFSVDSYRNIIEDPNIIYGYEDVPIYKSNDGKIFNLTDCLDFRPYINEANTISFNQPTLNGIFNNDITYYLPRVDYLVVNKDGLIYQKKGLSSETPKPPKLATDDSEMAIMLLKMRPYIYNVRTDVIKNFIDNKRYTMRDIGNLEKRISNLEYYTSFTLLEMQAETSSIKDAEGFDRYKNGFIAENFTDFLIADIQDSEFRASHDTRFKELRPAALPYNTNLFLLETDNTSINYKKIGTKILIDYDEEPFIVQPFSSKHISLNPYFIFEKKGIMGLFPNTDNWVDTVRMPELSVTVDTGVENLLPTEPIIETFWGSWNTMSEVLVSNTTTVKSNIGNWNTVVNRWASKGYTELTTSTQTDIIAKSLQRQGVEVTTTYETRVDSQDLGDRVTDAELMPYTRETWTIFAANNLKPNTRLYAFFDEEPVSQYCGPNELGSAMGDPLVSDSEGIVVGIFCIPANTFFSGQKTFRLTNEKINNYDQDTLLTSAEAKFWSGGLSLTKQSTTLNVNTFDMFIEEEGLTQNKVTVDVETTVTTSQKNITTSTWFDPLAQTFFNEVSCFVTSIEIYFQSVGLGDSIWVQIKNTENGYPGPIVFGETIIKADMMLSAHTQNYGEVNQENSYSGIQVSEDASVATRIEFPFPVFLEGDKEYAIVVGSFTPDSRIWCSLLGQNDVTHPEILINTQPSLGTLFKGQNNSTWTASQYEDMKLTINRAHFKYNYMRAMLQNKDSNEKIVTFNPLETQANSNKIRVYARNHGMSVGDKIIFNIGEGMIITLSNFVGSNTLIKNLFIGQKIFGYLSNDTATGTAYIKSISFNNAGSAVCVLTEVTGYFTAVAGSYIISEDFEIKIDEKYMHNMQLIRPITPPTQKTGLIKANIESLQSGSEEIFVNNTSITSVNGIPINSISTIDLLVSAVDSIDTFIVTASQNATSTGFVGGNVQFSVNRRFELFNVNGAYSSVECDESWAFYGIGHESNQLFSSDNFNRLAPKYFKPYTDVFLNQPYKFANRKNEISYINDGLGSVVISAEFNASTPYVSPVLDIDTFSSVLVSNRVDFIDSEEMDIIPNAIGRYVPETDPKRGSEVFKYVSKTIILKNPALDIKFFLDVYKPIYTDFDVYIKIQPSWDYDPIENKSWIQVTDIWKDFTSIDLTDYREVSFITNEILPTIFDGKTEFSAFKIKIVGQARNSANPPLFRKLRAIAVT